MRINLETKIASRRFSVGNATKSLKTPAVESCHFRSSKLAKRGNVNGCQFASLVVLEDTEEEHQRDCTEIHLVKWKKQKQLMNWGKNQQQHSGLCRMSQSLVVHN